MVNVGKYTSPMDPMGSGFQQISTSWAKVSRELCDVAIPLDVGDSHLCLCGAVSMVCGVSQKSWKIF